MIFRRQAIFLQRLAIFLQTSYFFPMKLLKIKKPHVYSSYLENTGKTEKIEDFFVVEYGVRFSQGGSAPFDPPLAAPAAT